MWAVLEFPNACQGNSEQQHRVQANEDTSCCATQLEISRLRSFFLTRCEYLGIYVRLHFRPRSTTQYLRKTQIF